MPDLTLGVDLSDHTARLAVVDDSGQAVARAEALPTSGGLVNGVRDAAKRVLAAAGTTVSAIGVAMPAPGEQLPPEINTVLREVSSRQAEIHPISAGTAAVLAEQWCGAARGLKQVIAFSVAEHVTAGVLLNGQPWHGSHGLAGSVAWLAMNPVEREDYRRFGGLEAEIASAGMVRRFVWRIKSGDESVVADRVQGDFSKITAEDILQAGRAGDGVSISVVRDTAKYIGMAVANLAIVFDPETIVLGGMIAESGDVMLEAIKVECSRRLPPQQAELLHLVLSTLGNDAVAIGAARGASRAGIHPGA
ncbi:MAG TPA: ROK family protein [Vicinamibacterales bacterium]|nr:ROK family protein [Vicinamibacterales bacterium]